jgi:hypothetical protein
MHVSLARNGGELLPHSPEPNDDQCSKPEQDMYCFKAGLYYLSYYYCCCFDSDKCEQKGRAIIEKFIHSIAHYM